MNLFSSFFVLTLVIGFPRVYGTEIPLAMFVAPFYLLGFVNFINRKPVLWFGFFFIYFVAIIHGLLVFSFSPGVKSDLFFYFVIYVKIIFLIYFSYVVYYTIRKSYLSLLLWILFQLSIVLMSSFNYEFYSVLLGFISPRSADVFQHIFGLRALGFGVFHMDGALTLVFSVFLYLILAGGTIISYSLMIFVFPFSMMVARSAIIPYSLLFIMQKQIILKVLFFAAIGLMFFLSFIFESGPIYQSMELFRNIVSGKGVHVDSVVHLNDMFVFPSNISTYFFGDGRFFGDLSKGLSFYMGTDVGYLRILFYSGLPGVFLFVVLNIYFLVYVLIKNKNTPYAYSVYLLTSILVFFIINFKGIQSMSIFSYVLFYFILDRLNVVGSNHK